MRNKTFLQNIVLAAGLASLGACGGGSDTPAVDASMPTPAPAFDTSSPQAFSGGVSALAADETAEPVDVEVLSPPTSETDEPVDVT